MKFKIKSPIKLGFKCSRIVGLWQPQKNIVFFYTPTELIEKKITSGNKVRIGGYVKETSLKQISLNQYKFKIK